MRVVAALGSVLAAIVLGVLAGWCWQRGVIVTRQDGVQLSRLDGSWIAIAIAVATLAGIALIDAMRRALLAVQ